MEKQLVCLLCGGQSTEHEVSLRSAHSVFRAFPREDYAVAVIGITRQGIWKYYGDREFLSEPADPRKVRLLECEENCCLCRTEAGPSIRLFREGREIPVAIALPILHGANGEDGTIQGFFQLLGLPFVGCDAASSANCMDKELTKILLEHAGILTSPGVTLRSPAELQAEELVARFGLPLFVKPSRAGSSIGISKVKRVSELAGAVQSAFQYDDKVLVEQGIVGREIECAVLDDGENLFCALPGEVIPHAEFYSYEAKYLTDDGATLMVPAQLEPALCEKVQGLARRAFRALGCRVFCRIDFFVEADGTCRVNEINTIPGFTSISLYPQLMACSGIDYQSLLRKMLQGTMLDFQRRSQLRIDADSVIG